MKRAEDPLLDEFCDRLWLEDGLARNTLESYRRDLRQFAEWLRKRQVATLPDASKADVLAYLAHRVGGAQRRAPAPDCSPASNGSTGSWCRQGSSLATPR
jgi:integrase/recombinase XerD